MSEEIESLIEKRVVVRVEPDPATAREELEMARRHLAAAETIAELDPTLAFTGLYDAIQKAISAHMRSNGFRVPKGLGTHVKAGQYARVALQHLGVDEHLDEFDVLRDLRNQSEYDARAMSSDDVEDASARALAIVRAIERDLDDGQS